MSLTYLNVYGPQQEANSGHAAVIPRFVKEVSDGKPLLEDNPVTGLIIGNIVRAIAHPDLEQIAGNARALVKRDFTHQGAVKR